MGNEIPSSPELEQRRRPEQGAGAEAETEASSRGGELMTGWDREEKQVG